MVLHWNAYLILLLPVRDIYDSKPVIRLREDAKYYNEIKALLDNDHPPTRKSQEVTAEVSVC